MALIAKRLYDLYQYALTDLPDPRVENLWLMGSPFPMIFLDLSYLYFVLKIGPDLMRNRKPFNLDKILILYNLIQIIGCSYVVIGLFKTVIFELNWSCSPVDYSNTPKLMSILKIGHLYFVLKVIDLLDTVFFVLKKNERQITFLHCYHHCGMVFIIWIGLKYLGGGQSMYIPLVNSFVHVVMYFYYLLTNVDKSHKRNIWWKKHITQLQLAQFFFLFVTYTQLIFKPDCTFPKWICMILVPQFFMMTLLFGEFYYNTYVKTKKVENVKQ